MAALLCDISSLVVVVLVAVVVVVVVLRLNVPETWQKSKQQFPPHFGFESNDIDLENTKEIHVEFVQNCIFKGSSGQQFHRRLQTFADCISRV